MYVSRVDHGGVYDLNTIAHQVALESGVNERQFEAAVGTLVDAMIVFLKGGHGVSLQDFGTFIPEVKSASSEDPGEVGVRRLRVSFRPHKKLIDALSEVTYDTEKEFATVGTVEDGSDTENGSTDTGNSEGTEFS